MLTTRAKEYLASLSYNPAAERIHCIVPLGGIHWKDELPDFDSFSELPESDQDSILRLFSIRFQIWAGRSLSEDDAAYWNEAESLLPRCPIFQRLKLSADDQEAQSAVEKDFEQFCDAMFSGATDLTITEANGITKISATRKLTDEDD